MKKFYILALLLLSQLINASQLENVSIQLKWKHSFQFAGYYAAIEKGFYKEKGLNVTLKEIDMSRDFIQDVVDGKSQYGVSDSSLIIRRQENEPVVLISQIFQHSPLVLISHRDSNITTPYEMSNKKIMYSLNNSGGTPFNALFLNSIGSYKELNITEFTNYQDFIDKKVDVTSAYSTSQPYMLKKQGININIIDPKSYGIDFYGDNFFTTENELKNHPKRVENMREATLKGWEYALSNQKEIIDLIIQKYAPKSDKDLLYFESRGIYQMILPDLTKVGSVNKDKYEKVIKTYHKLGLVKNSNIDESFFYHKKLHKALLTDKEKRWIRENPNITFAGDPDWMPFESFDEQGNYKGIVADYLNEIEKRVDLSFKPTVVNSWNQTLKIALDASVDVISGDINNIILTKNYEPITPYIETPIVIVTNNKHSFINDLEDIKDKKIAIINDYGYTVRLKSSYKNIDFIKIPNIQEAFDKLLFEKIDALLLSMPAASYLIKTRGLDSLKISGKTVVSMHPTLFVRKDKPLLHSIIEKTMVEIGNSKHREILGKWQKIEFAKRVDYSLIYQLLAIFSLFILGALYWNRKLKAEVIKREESEMQIRTLMDIIPLNILVTTYNGRVLFANPQTLKDHKISEEDIKNYNILDFYSNPKEREIVLNELKERGSVKQKIVKFKSSNSKTYDLMISLLPITYHKQNALLALGVDLTDRLKMEKELSLAKESAEKANLAKSEFLANMSHEIRTPMNSVIGFTELLSKLIKDPIQKDYLDSINRGGQSLLAIINDILDLSKIEAGKMEIVLESVDLKQLIYEMESIFSVKLIQKNLIFEVVVDESIPKYLLLDNTRVRQILFNVIGNAIKFTNNGKIKLTVKRTFSDNKKSKVNLLLIVEDSGIGIKKENLRFIFDSFEQQQGQYHKYGGTGLGLAICKKLLSIMNGKISVESEFGKGSKFIISLEEISISSIEKRVDKSKNITKELKFKPSIILIVDDITDNRKLVHWALKPYGFTIIEAVNGKDALEKLKNIKVDLIFMDIKMPIMDGYEATQIIKSDQLLKKIPIIALTASVMGRDMEKIINYKFDGYLRKPVSIDKLVEEIARFLPHQSLEIQEDNGMQISQDGYKYLASVIESLEREHLITWERIKDKGDFEPIESFADELKNLIENKGIYLLEGFAKELKLSCESFDIEQIDFLMNNFPNVIKKLKKMLKNE